MRWVFVGFLFIHGLIHAAWLSPAPPESGGPAWPFDIRTSKLLSALGVSPMAIRAVGTALVAVVLAGFAAAALGAAGVPGLFAAWRGLTVAAALASAALMIVYWDPWFPVGLVIDAALIITVLGRWWPASLVH